MRLISSTVTPSTPRSARSSSTATWIARRVASRLRSRSPGSARSVVVTSPFLHRLQYCAGSAVGILRGDRALREVVVHRVVDAGVRLVVRGVALAVVGDEVRALELLGEGDT